MAIFQLLIVPSIALGTGCFMPCNYVAYTQVGEADKKVKKHIIRYSLVINALKAVTGCRNENK